MFNVEPGPLLIVVKRKQWAPDFEMIFPDGSSEEVEATEAVEWFRLRHASIMPITIIEKALDFAWNFGEVEILIKEPRRILASQNRVSPKV